MWGENCWEHQRNTARDWTGMTVAVRNLALDLSQWAHIRDTSLWYGKAPLWLSASFPVLWRKVSSSANERLMDSLSVPSPSDSDNDSSDRTPAPDSSRRTTHTGKQDGLSSLGYGLGEAWQHLRPFIPFFLISFMVVALVYLMQAIIYGGPFKDPLFFVKFNERWPRPTPGREDSPSPSPTEGFSTVTSSSLEQILFDLKGDNETMWTEETIDFFLDITTRSHQGSQLI